MTQHTLTEVLTTLDAIVAEFGADYRYKDHYASCAYRNHKTGEPQCIVGQVLARLEPGALAIVNNTGTWETRPEKELFTPEANQALTAAQQVQDGRTGTYYANPQTWGAAVAAAKEAVA